MGDGRWWEVGEGGGGDICGLVFTYSLLDTPRGVLVRVCKYTSCAARPRVDSLFA
jgi:hypothetical protein